jgi:hypothetical protein
LGGGLELSYNISLQNLEGVNALDKIGGSLSLWENNAFNSFSGLENITEINKSLFISNCPLLHNFLEFDT